MLRKTVILILLTTSSAWGAGFYVGAGVGPEQANFNQVGWITQPGTTQVKDTDHLAGKGFFGSLFAGYQWNKNKCYLASEANADLSSVEYKASNSEYVHQSFSRTSYRIRNNVGLSLLPGYLFSPFTLFYARLGYANGNFKTSSTDSSTVSVDRNLSGFRYGLGLREKIADKWDMRLEFSQTEYQNTSFLTVDNSSSTNKKTTIAPTTSQVEFGIIYNC